MVVVVIPKYNKSMKTAISVPDDVFTEADTLAEEMGVSRSELYSTAVAEFVAKHRDRDVTAQLDAVHGELEEGLDPALDTAQRRIVRDSEW